MIVSILIVSIPDSVLDNDCNPDIVAKIEKESRPEYRQCDISNMMNFSILYIRPHISEGIQQFS